MSIRAFEVLDSSWTWRITVCLIVLESMVGLMGFNWARREEEMVWLLARLPQEINDGIGSPRKSNRAVAVLAPRAFRLRLTLGRTPPPVSNSAAGGIASFQLRHWAAREARLRTAGS